MQLLEALQKEAVNMMLFLKSVECIEVHLWGEKAVQPTLLFRCHLQDQSSSLRASRSIFASQVVTYD